MYLILNSRDIIVEVCKHPCYVRRQTNGIVILSDKEEADAIYSNDTNTFYPLERVGYLNDAYSLAEVETVPSGVVAGYYFYQGGEIFTTEEMLTALNASEDTNNLLLDHEYRLTMLEIMGGE